MAAVPRVGGPQVAQGGGDARDAREGRNLDMCIVWFAAFLFYSHRRGCRCSPHTMVYLLSGINVRHM